MSTLAGLQLALKHCTKYEDRMFLQFLIKVEERNILEEGIKAADEGRVETLESVKEKWKNKK